MGDEKGFSGLNSSERSFLRLQKQNAQGGIQDEGLVGLRDVLVKHQWSEWVAGLT